MAGSRHESRRAHSLRLLLVMALVAAVGSVVAAPPRPTDALSAWTGGVDLYRSGVFTTQKTWLWCTAADVQIMRNIVRRTSDHTTKGQRRYFAWMRQHNRYRLPLSAGVDAQGWTAGLRHFVDDRYRLVASKTFDSALRLAVTRLRETNLPVGITVSHGNHAWILTGFRATADPARTTDFRVTSVRVVGPLYGRQTKNGYDMKPDTRLTVAQFRHYFTPWRYAPRRMVWDGRYISIQPVPATAAPTATSTGVAAAEAVRPAALRPLPVAAWVGPSLVVSLAVTLTGRRVRARRPRRLRRRTAH